MQKRLQFQLVFTLLAAVCVAGLSALLIGEALSNAETAVVGDTRRTLSAANLELGQQLAARSASDTSFAQLPSAAMEVSLRGISQTVLRSYPGVEGGFSRNSSLMGYSFPTHDSGTLKTDLPAAERDDIMHAVADAATAGETFRLIRGTRDLVAIEALRQPEGIAWSMKRLPGLGDPNTQRRSWLLAGLVLAALLSIIGALTTVIALRVGIREIQLGLRRLKGDFAYQLPVRSDELGEISASVNEMAFTRRKLEQELRREDRLRSMGRLTASLAHEIRNPLNSIRLAMQSLDQRLAMNTARREDLTLVVGEVDRLNNLLSQSLAFGFDSAPEIIDQPLCPVVQRCVDLITPQAAIRGNAIAVECKIPNLNLAFDASRLTQALTNLLLNALEASEPGDSVAVQLNCNGKRVSIGVRDSGPGIQSDAREHLFEPFYTTKDRGTGLGLAVSRELIQGMGGSLRHKDAEPGSEFVIEFPYVEQNGSYS